MTNFEKIKAMSSEEFARFLRGIAHNCTTSDHVCTSDCPLFNASECSVRGVKEWLESEVEE